MSAKRQALVLEGGGYRGVFTAGVLDVLMDHGIYDFSDVWGTSAGALNALNYKSRQVGRQIRITLAFRDDPRMMSFWSLATTGSIMDNQFMYEQVQREIDPFDYQTFNSSDLRLWTVASNVMFGRAEYSLISHLPDQIDLVKASASLPVFSETVIYDHKLLLDGGTCDSVAVEAALGLSGFAAPDDASYEPADKALVVLTQPRSYVKLPLTPGQVTSGKAKYADYPYFLEAYLRRPEVYNAQRKRILKLEKEGKIKVIAPEEPLSLSVTEENGSKLLHSYIAGRTQAERHLEEIKDFLA